ncbi:MAG: type 1 glutamine amidotransferase [Mycetocola sp.]
MSVSIVELYPETLSLNGDVGNRTALAYRARLAGLDVVESSYRVGDDVPASDVDVILIGSGTSSAVHQIASDLERIAPWIRERVAAGAVMVAAGAGFSLMTRSVRFAPDDVLTGVGVFDADTDASAARTITEGFAFDSEFGLIVGTENHTTTVTRDATQAPFGSVRYGKGNGDQSEGAISGNAIGTHCHGPLLPMNPVLTDALLTRIAEANGESYRPGAAHHDIDAVTAQTRAILLTKSGIADASL